MLVTMCWFDRPKTSAIIASLLIIAFTIPSGRADALASESYKCGFCFVFYHTFFYAIFTFKLVTCATFQMNNVQRKNYPCEKHNVETQGTSTCKNRFLKNTPIYFRFLLLCCVSVVCVRATEKTVIS